MDQPEATVRIVNGQPVLYDPAAEGMMCAVEAHNRGVDKANCRLVFEESMERVRHFAGRIAERGLSPNDVVIVIVNAEDPHGSLVADALIPGHNWQAMRDRGEKPYARGLASREGMQKTLDLIDQQAAETLRSMAGRIAAVVIDHTTAECFAV